MTTRNGFWHVKSEVLCAGTSWTATQRLVALAVADRMRDVGEGLFECWCSTRDIGERTGLGRRTVRHALDALCKRTGQAIFTRRRRKSKRGLGSYIFRLVVSPRALAASREEGEATVAPLNLSRVPDQPKPPKVGEAMVDAPEGSQWPRGTSYSEPGTNVPFDHLESLGEKEQEPVDPDLWEAGLDPDDPERTGGRP